MIDLEYKHIEFIKQLIGSILPNAEIFIYGSRVQELAYKYSDVDIAINNFSEIPFEDLLKIKAKFRESTFPYKVDIVDLKSLKPNFLELIQKDLTKI